MSLKNINLEAKIAGTLIGLAILAVFAFAALHTAKAVGIASPPQTHIATSSTAIVGPQSVTTVFSAKTGLNCAARVITTAAGPIMLSFSADITPTGSIGHVQAASTTVAYDPSVYGCGAVKAYGYASTTITKSEFAY